MEGGLDMVERSSQQVGRCGELLVQYHLLKHGVDSASPTTDKGIDLVAFHGTNQKAVTIQVKTSSHRSDSTSKWLHWQIPEDCPSMYVAAVDLEDNRFWLLETARFKKESQQSGEEYRLWWYIPEHRPERATMKRQEDFSEFEMDIAVPRIFPLGDGQD